MYVSKLPPKKASGIHVLAMVYERKQAEAKNSQWVFERKPLEKFKSQKYSEIILCSKNGNILEGLINNVFIAEQCVNSGGEESGDLVLKTAGISENILPGIVR